jgi:hypothetical protein
MTCPGYDGVLAFGEALRERYLKAGWGRQVCVWHEAADGRSFRPMPGELEEGDLVWIGNWGDDERTAELRGVPDRASPRPGPACHDPRRALPGPRPRHLARAGIRYGGWIPNAEAPRAFARHRVTVTFPGAPTSNSSPASPRYAPSRRWPAASPLSPPPGTTPRGCSAPATSSGRERGRDAPHLRALWATPRCAPSRRRGAWKRSAPATPAATAWTELLAILRSSARPHRKTA